MLNVALFQPEIPPNTGNIIRLCANTGSGLHLIHPLGFRLDEKRLKRAGLDYHEWARIVEHQNFDAFQPQSPGRIIACETIGETCYADFDYQDNDTLLFGSETKGLPDSVLSQLPAQHIVRIPMQAYNRSLNLSNSVAIILYEAWRQLGFA